ncbi:matrixin family metalloprotease [Kribbella speibonae]|uniref:matrixin family metalloprotease n=1 Tax=Kribbella speibonae TaxID=1572660 RepID=UPI00192DA9E8|nr:matrixin family metalloprotease [Kribbella speibonae]
MTFDITELVAGLNLEPGTKGKPVRALQEYLSQFGYLAAPANDPYAGIRAGMRAQKPKAGTLDNTTVAALRRFQQYFGLTVTGVLDEATVSLMSLPRCGFPDRPAQRSRAEASVTIASFVAQGNKWDHTNISYDVEDFTGDLSQAEIGAAIQSALALWANAAPLTFTESDAPDIRIRFVTLDHDDGSPFDGAGSVLAHAFYPPPNGGDLAGDVHFDDDETWTTTLPVPIGGVDLATVAAHEFGHALGLAHSADSSSLMYPYYLGPHRYLSADDVLGIQTIYGARIYPVPGWFGSEDQGADIAVGQISTAGGQPDLVVFHVDNPGGENHGYYRIGWRLDSDGRVTAGWSDRKPVPGWFGAEDQGAGIALGDISGSGRSDLVVFHVDNPGGDNHGYYRIGWDIDANGNVTNWSDIRSVPGWFGWENQGAAIALADISGNGSLDLVVFHLDNPAGDNHGYYRIGWNLDKDGAVTGGWSPVRQVPGWFGWEDQGAGIAVADIDHNEQLDLLVFHIDNPGGENHGYYRIGSGLDTLGNVTGGWGPIVATPGWFGSEDQGAGVALADLNGNGRQDLIVFHVDNPGGENHGYYRVIGDL